MGRRKERRLAAMSAAGRRVKLDLFAEPSGDMGGSSTLEEVGGDGESKTHGEFPSSPSSSGQQPQNPLLLLEQYSDEELDEDSNEGHNRAVTEDASVGVDEEPKVVAGKEAGDGEMNNGKEFIQKVEQLQMDRGAASQDASQKLEKESITEIASDDLQEQTNKKEEASHPAEHLVGDMNSGWKMVLHEESNQYYYWNVLTGETSWEVPDVLAQETDGTSAENVIRDTKEKTDAVIGTFKSRMPSDMEEDDISTRELNVHSKVNFQTSVSADQGTKMDGSNKGFRTDSIEDKKGNIFVNQNNEISLLGGQSVESKRSADVSSQLIKHCESLLERLKSVKGLNYHLDGQDLKLKCTLEIEIRLADIKALASNESSLLPFWLHSEAQLKRLEAAVDRVIEQDTSAPLSGFEATPESCEGINDAAEIESSEKKGLFANVELHAGGIPGKSTFEAHNNDATTKEPVSSVQYSNAHPVNDVGEKSEIIGTEKGSELNPKPAVYPVEDTDMDVDMEVEDTPSITSPHEGASGAHYHVSTELSNVHNSLFDKETTVPGQVFSGPPPSHVEWIPPPPPDNEPIPPPPPDDEPFPPPPPDEPPETSSSYPPSHLGSVQAFPYSDQYPLSYPGSGLGYYGQTNPEASGNAFYTHSEGGQASLSHVPHYYEAVSNVYAVAPMTVNPVEPTAYYSLQTGTLNPVPLVNSSADSSGAQSEPVAEETGTAGSLDSHPEAGSSLSLKNDINVDKSCHGTLKASSEVHEAQPSIRAPVTSSVINGVSVSSTSDTTTSVSSVAAAAAAAAVAATKSQSKVSRTKKRTVAVVSTLRSNKKVSSLVDKWKAAKEELHEEEEEPEDAYEILEKKRQREIEQWRAHQITSGEAKENANFQPLGGDWRERVKRRRAEKMKGSGQTSPDGATDGHQQTDLIELSKGLPSGWQAYWDDSSKQVYYGNVLTSETTWIRPTD